MGNAYLTNFPAFEFFDDTSGEELGEYFYISLGVGVAVILHSLYLHRLKFSSVRVATDLSAFFMIAYGISMLYCYSWSSCSFETKVLFVGVINSTVFGTFIQAADNYLVFARYAIVVGGVSRLHVLVAFTWVSTSCYLTWVPFSTFIPFFIDTNSNLLMSIQNGLNQFNFYGYLAYDLFYLLALIQAIRKLLPKHLKSTASTNVWKEFVIRAIVHTLFSLLSIAVCSFIYPEGYVEKPFLSVIGNHVFLNWKGSGTWVTRVLTSKSRKAHSSQNPLQLSKRAGSWHSSSKLFSLKPSRAKSVKIYATSSSRTALFNFQKMGPPKRGALKISVLPLHESKGIGEIV